MLALKRIIISVLFIVGTYCFNGVLNERQNENIHTVCRATYMAFMSLKSEYLYVHNTMK